MGQILIYGTNKKGTRLYPFKMARPERFELPTTWFEARIPKLKNIITFSCLGISTVPKLDAEGLLKYLIINR
jgi:hypothetical protein